MTSGISSSDPGLISSVSRKTSCKSKRKAITPGGVAGLQIRWGRQPFLGGFDSHCLPPILRSLSAAIVSHRIKRLSRSVPAEAASHPSPSSPDQRSPLIPKRTPARRLPATRRPAMVGQQHAHSVLAGITGQQGRVGRVAVFSDQRAGDVEASAGTGGVGRVAGLAEVGADRQRHRQAVDLQQGPPSPAEKWRSSPACRCCLA